jgi:hypothetical protein
MSDKDYVGYSLFDKVIIVAKNIIERYDWKDQVCTPIFSDRWQGYIVDPSNKNMLKSALEWGRQRFSVYENGKFSHYDTLEPQQFEFENKGWIMEILKVAEGSSQGGKLSFWTCKVTKDDKTFEVGINADLLLDVIKAHTLVQGKCEVPLMFARCKGGVGLLSEDMEEYKQALADMQRKKDVKTKKTSKHVVGHVYSSLTQSDIYAADLYCWYEPIEETYVQKNCWGNTTRCTQTVGFRKLETPKLIRWFPVAEGYSKNGVCKLSDLRLNTWSLTENKLPARVDEGFHLEYDVPLDDKIKEFNADLIKFNPNRGERLVIYKDYVVGLSPYADTYELPDNLREALQASGYRIED